MTHSKSTKDRKDLVEKLLNFTLHAHSPQAQKFWHFVSRKVVHSYVPAPAEVIIVFRTVTSVVRNFPPMAEPDDARWRHERTGAREEDTSSSTDVEPERVELFDVAQDNPWRVLEFHHITHADAIIQHHTDVLKNFRRLSKQHHPDKCSDPEMKAKKHTMMQQLIKARSMILVRDTGEDGLPNPDWHAQKMRVYYADKFLHNPAGPAKEGVRRRTQGNFEIGQTAIFSGKKMCHNALMSLFCSRKRNLSKSELPASQALAIVQEGHSFDWADTPLKCHQASQR